MPTGSRGISKAKFGEALSGEFSLSLRAVSDNPLTEGNVQCLKSYAGKLYASVGPTGAFYEYDGYDWKKVYEFPETDPSVTRPWKGITWASLVTKPGETLIWGGFSYPWNPYGACVVRYDGVTWKRIACLPVSDMTDEIFSLCQVTPADQRIYAGTGNRKILTSEDDGLTWRHIYTLPSGPTVNALAQLGTSVYAGTSNEPGVYGATGVLERESLASRIWSPVALPKAMGITAMRRIYDTHPRVRAERLIIGTSIGDVYLYDGTTFYLVGRLKEPVYDFTPQDYEAAGGASARGVIYAVAGERFGRGSVWQFNLDERLWEQLSRFPGFSPLTLERYENQMFVGAGYQTLHGYKSGGKVGGVWRISPFTRRYLPPFRQYKPFDAQSIGIAEVRTSEPIPCAGYERKTISLLDTQAATLDIEVDPDGIGNWQDYITAIVIAANTPYHNMITYGFPYIRLEVTQGGAAGVLNSWVNTEN